MNPMPQKCCQAAQVKGTNASAAPVELLSMIMKEKGLS